MLYAVVVASVVEAVIIAGMIWHMRTERRALGRIRAHMMGLRSRVAGVENACVSIEGQVAQVKKFALSMQKDVYR